MSSLSRVTGSATRTNYIYRFVRCSSNNRTPRGVPGKIKNTTRFERLQLLASAQYYIYVTFCYLYYKRCCSCEPRCIL